MKYYVLADPHGFYDIMIKTLTEKGFFTDPDPCKLIVCGDLMDRGEGTLEMQRFMTELLAEGRLIYVRGNHEDLMEQMLWQIEEGQEFRVLSDGTPVPVHNGTWQTALRLAGMTEAETKRERDLLVRRVRKSDYYTTLMPAALDYFETEHYVFTHGYIPCHAIQGTTKYMPYKDFYQLERGLGRGLGERPLVQRHGVRLPEEPLPAGQDRGLRPLPLLLRPRQRGGRGGGAGAAGDLYPLLRPKAARPRHPPGGDRSGRLHCGQRIHELSGSGGR